MAVYAAVMTGKGTGAIATVQLFGHAAQAVLAKVFKPSGSRHNDFKPGAILLGAVVDGDETIDQVTIGCEGPESLAIHCHGNPLIVEMIMKLLRSHGVVILTAEELLSFAADESLNAIAIEAKPAQLSAKTLLGTKIIAGQIDAGLTGKTTQWLDRERNVSLDQIKAEARRILENSRPAGLIISGCTAVLAGPPNSGKSTLLNCLAGRQKAIVTDIEGTTRDWVSATCRIGPLSVKLIDTAGLDRELAVTSRSTIENAAQDRTSQLLEDAELVLLVLDNSRDAGRLDGLCTENIAGKRILTVLNKSDLPAKFDPAGLPESLGRPIQISAKLGTGIHTLKQNILQTTATADFDPKTPVAFTSRQKKLLRQLATAKSSRQSGSIISKLLNGGAR